MFTADSPVKIEMVLPKCSRCKRQPAMRCPGPGISFESPSIVDQLPKWGIARQSKSRLETDRVTSTGRAAMSFHPTEGAEAPSVISGSGPSAKATLVRTLRIYLPSPIEQTASQICSSRPCAGTASRHRNWLSPLRPKLGPS
jgi:hypothetical protein